jgi:hypothetical protein
LIGTNKAAVHELNPSPQRFDEFTAADRSRLAWKPKADVLVHRIVAPIDGMSVASTSALSARLP